MKKISMLILLFSFVLSGCNNDGNEDLDSIAAETNEVFGNIDFSNYTITSVEKLLYDNGQADYEYELLTNLNNKFMTNIIEMSKKFPRYNSSEGLVSVIGGERVELRIILEDGEETISVEFYKGMHQGDVYRKVMFVYRSGEDKYFMGFNYAFPTEIENIYNLANE